MEKFQLHPDYQIYMDRPVQIDNYDGTFEYAIVRYEPDVASFVLNYYSDNTYTIPVFNEDNTIKTDQLQDIGYEVIKPV